MSASLPKPKPNLKRLHSPLLDGNKINNKTYKNPNEEIDFLFSSNKKQENQGKSKNQIKKSEKQKEVNLNLIDLLETSFKIATIFICAIGGILSLLELIPIIKIISTGSLKLGNNLVIFVAVFIGTILVSIVCLGVIQLIKAIKHIYNQIEIQNQKFEKIISILTQ